MDYLAPASKQAQIKALTDSHHSESKIFGAAHRTKSGLLEEAKKVCGADPEEMRGRLQSASDFEDDVLVDLHHEVLLETQGVVKGHLHFITGLQALSTALREREHMRCRAGECVMEMFSVRCLCTIWASLLAQCGNVLLELLLEELFGILKEDAKQDLANLIERLIYAGIAMLLVPPLQFRMAKLDRAGIYTRAHAAVGIFTKGLPMILAWSIKDVVEALLKLSGGLFWDELVVTVLLILGVTGLKHLPAVARAKDNLQKQPRQDSLCNRYLNMPDHMLLACGFAFNQVMRFLVELAAKYNRFSAGAQMIMEVVLQIVYFSFTSLFVIRLEAWFTETRLARDRAEAKAMQRHDWILAAELEAASGLGDTMTHALAFVYGWGVSDTLRSVYYHFFVGCGSWTACSYPLVWAFAILSTLVLSYAMQQLSLQDFRTATCKSYRSLMTTAMSLTLGWAWMNVCESTTSFFLNELELDTLDVWIIPVVYGCLFIFVYFVLVEVYWQILFSLRISRRERHEFYQAYPLLPMEEGPGRPSHGEQTHDEPPNQPSKTEEKVTVTL